MPVAAGNRGTPNRVLLGIAMPQSSTQAMFIYAIFLLLLAGIHAQTVTVTVTQTAVATAVNMIARQSIPSTRNFCDPATGRVLNASVQLPPAYLANPRQMVVGRCFTDNVDIVAGDQSTATVLLSCRGGASFLQVFAYRATATCPKNGTSLFGLVFPSGRNCTARRNGHNPPYELGYGSNPCRQPATIGTGVKTEFASVFNMFTVGWQTGVGGPNYQSNVTVANGTSVEALFNGVQVMVLDEKNNLAINTKQYVTISLVTMPDSSSLRWGRRPRLVGTTRAQAHAGVASFGRLGIASAGTYRLVACLTGTAVTATNATGCTESARFHVVGGPVSKMMIISQANATQVVSMYDPTSKNAVFTERQGPINVTWEDSMGNRGSNERVHRIGRGFLLMNVTCSRVGQAEQKQVTVVRESWRASRGWVAFGSLGPLRDAINRAFGAGAASFQDGYNCFGRIGASLAVSGRGVKEPVVQTNTWRVRA